MNLTRFETEGGVELVIAENGESFATVRGYARMSGRDVSTISRRLKGVASDRIKDAEILTPGGVQGVALISEDVITDWIVEDNPSLAKVMLKSGVRVFLHTAAGYKLTSEAVAPTSQPQPIQLPPADVRISNLISALDRIGFDMQNPRFNQGIKDITGDILGLGQPMLALKSANNETWCGVAERAEQLGYPVGEIARKRSQLGKWVARGTLPKKQEARLCNGTQRSVNLYLVTDELDSRINSFFAKS